MSDSRTVGERFWAKVNKTDTCWSWTASTYRKGYGKFKYGGRSGYAHRYAYEQLVGSVPDGLEVDHLCRNRSCVNPAHLELVTTAENLRRGVESRLRQLLDAAAESATPESPTCPQGHVMAGPNLIVRTDKRWAGCVASHLCRACKRASSVRRQRRIAGKPIDLFGARVR